jgi:tRNA-dihydrouridine synthase A
MFGGCDAPDEQTIVGRYINYMAEQMEAGVKLNALTKHLLHSFNGRQGARRFRQILSDASRLKANDLSLVEEALEPLGLVG